MKSIRSIGRNVAHHVARASAITGLTALTLSLIHI